MTPFAVRVPISEQGVGKVGYLYARGDDNGAWRITARECGVHDLVGECDTPDALIPRLRDSLEDWCRKQAATCEDNLAILARAPARRQGFRPNWKPREIAYERVQLRRAVLSAGRVLQIVASVLHAHGWPLDGYDGPLIDLAKGDGSSG